LVLMAVVFLAATVPLVCQSSEGVSGSAGGANQTGSNREGGERVLAQARAAVGEQVHVTTAGRGSFQGELWGVREDRIELLTADGQIIQIALSEVDGIQALSDGEGRRGLFLDAAANRLVVMPTGFPMERGELHVTDQQIAVVTSSYGLTDTVSLWGGISIPGLVLSARLAYQPAPALGLSAGTFIGAEWFEFTTLALPYALASFGTPNRNITVGGGPIYTFFGTADDKAFEGAILALGGKTVLTPTAAIVTETWSLWFPRNDSILFAPSVVFRIAGSRLSWDLGAVVPFTLAWGDGGSNGDGRTGRLRVEGLVDGTVVPLPLVSVTYRID
jgi:hypothetical protein